MNENKTDAEHCAQCQSGETQNMFKINTLVDTKHDTIHY